MKEKKRDETRRVYALIRSLGVMVLALFMLVSIAGAEPYAYITNSGDNTVSVIDTATNTVTASVSVGSGPLGVAVAPSPEPVEIHTTQITTSGSASNPHICVDRIVYEDRRNGKSDIYMYDLSTKQETQISTSGTANAPAIYDDRIVWNDNRNGDEYNMNWNLYMYDLSTQQEIQITTSESASDPHIYGNRIVWVDGNDIYMYDLSNSKETQITTSGSAYSPDIYGDRIVWVDGNDIYIGTVSEGELEPVLPVANFSSNVTEGYAPLYVKFTDLSKNATDISWDFQNDGLVDIGPDTAIEDSNIVDYDPQNPIYAYTAPGTYTVSLTASNANGTDSKLATITVLEQPVPPVADFSASPTIGKVPLTVTFTDQSTGSPTSWSWKFGDKIISKAQNPEHIYNKAGKYTVTLTVENEFGSDTRKISKYIIVKKK